VDERAEKLAAALVLLGGALALLGGLVTSGRAGEVPSVALSGVLFALAALAFWLGWRGRPRAAPVLEGPLQSLACPLLVVDADGRVREANAAFRNRVGAPEALGARIDDWGAAWEGLARAVRGREVGAPVRVGFRHPSGLRRAFVFVVHRLPRDTAFLVEGEDRTELSEAREQLTNFRRNASLERLASGATHDFNNMLTAMVTTLELLREELGEPPNVEEARSLVEILSEAAGRARSITKGLLNVGRRGDVSVEEVEIDVIVDGVTDLLKRTLGARVHVRACLHAPGVTVFVDRAALENALLNLALNARDAMPGGGRLTLSTRALSPAAWLETYPQQTAFPGQLGVELRVEDEGTGMSEEVRARIFDPFFTTKGRGKGSGLGLPGVVDAVRAVGGTLGVESKAGVGTTVCIALPARDPTLARPPGVVSESSPGTG
jgi:signal transduction histidine kinase